MGMTNGAAAVGVTRGIAAAAGVTRDIAAAAAEEDRKRGMRKGILPAADHPIVDSPGIGHREDPAGTPRDAIREANIRAARAGERVDPLM